MNFETFPLEKKTANALDDHWYENFKELAIFADYEYLTGDKNFREKQKTKFLSNEIENPILDYPELENFDFDQKEQGLLSLKKRVLEEEPNEVVRQLYRWRINEKLAELRMLKAAHEGNDRRFTKYSAFIYGRPEKEIYAYTIFQVKKIIDQKLSDENQEKRDAAVRLNKELFEVLLQNETGIKSSDFSFPEKIATEDKTEYSADGIKLAFEKALQEYSLHGWTVLVDKDGRFANINVSQEKNTINIPANRKLKHSQLLALIRHEIGTHVLRREKGENSKLRLLGLGLDRYLKGEEGIATYQEQQLLGAKEFAGLDGHFAISLALGIDGRPRNFRQVFEILKDFHFINSKKDGEEAVNLSKKSAWSSCVRIFRGTTCKTPGQCFTKDIVYREGNIGTWNVVRNNPEETKRFSVGKYDPSNLRHIWILEQLGINENDLQELEK